VGILVNWWSDLEQDAREAADFVLHVPLAPDEIGDVLAAAIPMQVKDSLTATVPDVVVSAEQAMAGPAVPLPALGFR
jgi:hypothetical protein